MSTTLAEQLERLAVPQTNLLQRDKTRPSLLFDPREAAGWSRETIYQIGLDGLEELIKKNSIFEQFRSNLFDLTSKNFERSVQTGDVNKELDEKIRKFLLLLSPYFLLTCSHKALEWLIVRYHIHDYNREDLLMLIMPYHESNIFVRVIQLMKFKDSNDKWFFLKSLQKTGVHLNKQNLLIRAATDVYFLKFTADFITLITEEYEKASLLNVAFNYFCSVFVGALEYSEKVNETQISVMLPVLLQGLKSDIADYCASSYVIIAKLLTKASLIDSILNQFITQISRFKVESLRVESVLLINVLYQSQKQYKEITERALEDIVKHNWIIKILDNLNREGCLIWPFVEVLIRTCVEIGLYLDEEDHRKFVEDLQNTLKFDNDFVGTFLRSFLDAVDKWSNNFAQHLQDWLKGTLEIVERQYPEQFDKEVYKILSTTDTKIDRKRKVCLQKIFKNSMSTKSKFDIFEKLYHPNQEFRLQAIDYLTENYNLLREREKHVIKTIIIDRLNDNSLTVINETLMLLDKVPILERDDLKRILIKLCRKCQNDLQIWEKVASNCVHLLCKNSKENDWDVFVAVIPFLLPKAKNELQLAKKIAKTDFIQKNPIRKLRNLNCEIIAKAPKFCNLILRSLQNNDFEIIKKIVLTLREIPQEDRDCLHKFVVMFVISYLLPDSSPIEISSLVVEIFAQYLKDSVITSNETDNNFATYLQLAREDKFPKEAYLSFLKKIVEKTQNININLGTIDLYQSSDCTRFYSNLMNLLYNFDNSKFIQTYLNEICGVNTDFKAKIEFLLNLNLSNNEFLDGVFYEKSINTIVALFKDNIAEDFDELVKFNEILVPYLLILLDHQSERIRKKVFNIIEICSKEITKKTNNYCGLLKNLLQYKEEIVLDHEQLPLILFNVLESTKLRHCRENLLKTFNNEELPLYYKAELLKLLSHFNTIELLEAASKICLTILENPDFDKIKRTIIIQTVNRINSGIADQIKPVSNIWKLISSVLKLDQIKIDNNYLIVSMLIQFDREFMANLNDNSEIELLDLIVEIVTITTNSEILPIANRIFKHIDLDVKLVIEHLFKMRNVQSPKLDPNKLKRRISIVPTIDILDTLEWRKGVTLLEFLQDKKKIRNTEVLLPVLFEILKKCLDFDEQIAVEYPKQLILSLILHCCHKLDNDNKVQESVFNVELIVQCIRASSNPQTHHHALLVLAHLAKLIPTQVLHHVMAIFTFIGSSILRHDDAYSYQIILKIIDNIIPILIDDNTLETIVRVLRVFVDVLLDVPEHRRLPLYKQLLIKIGVKENLHVFLLLIFESHVLHNNRIKDKSDDSKKRLDIAKLFCCEFEPNLVLATTIKLLQFLKQLPDEIKDNESFDDSTYNIHFNTAKQFRHYKYTLVTFTANLLSSQEFINCIAKLTDEELCSLEGLYKDLIINILTYIQRISKVTEKNSTTPQSQYWKVLIHHSYDILDSINALLTPQMFLLVIKGLMTHNLSTVKRRSLELLNSKLQYNPNFFQKCNQDEIYSLIPPLIQIIQMIQQNELDKDQELLIQTALLSIKLLVRLLATKQPEKFLDVFEFIIDLMKLDRIQNNILASIILCLAEFCVSLRAHSIGYLPNFMPNLLKILKHQQNLAQKQQEQEPNLLLLSVVTALQKIVDTLPSFMSSYLQKILVELSTFSLENNEQKWHAILNKIKHIRNRITTIPPRILLPTINETYNYLIEKKSYNRIAILMDIFSESLRNLTGSDVTTNLQDLTKFFLNALEFRSNQYTDFDTTNYIEMEIVKTFSIFALKLSESTFRPLYQDVYHWAQNNDNERLITFYNLSKEMANSLKGLFVLFANQFINNAAQILKDSKLFTDNNDKNLLLLENVLRTLLLVFTYDNKKFINKERFELLMPVLVDQLENDLGGIECLKERCQNLLIPCIVQFTVATADDSLWKRLNYSVLLKTKNKSQVIRLLALNCVTEIVMKVGEDFLPLLPETIPFLAELLEDEEEDVEKVCRKSIQMMEKILGEPIQKYF